MFFSFHELIAHSTTKNTKAYVVSVDQENVFDKVYRNVLYKIMGSLNTLKSLLISSKESIQAHNLLFLIMAFYPILYHCLEDYDKTVLYPTSYTLSMAKYST